MPGYENGRPLPVHLLDIKALPELRGIVERDHEIEIGALTTIEQIRANSAINTLFTALVEAADQFAGPQIRHRATIGGNLVNASPAGDTLPPLYAYGAVVKITGPAGERTVPLEEFITGPGQTTLAPGELVQSVILPKLRHRSLFYKLGLRQAMAIAVVNFAITYAVKNGAFSHLAIAAGAVAPKVVLLDTLTEALVSRGATIDDAMHLVDNDISPIDDLRAPADYRRTVLKNVLAYTLRNLLGGGNGR